MCFRHVYEHFDMTLNSGFKVVFEGDHVAEKPCEHGILAGTKEPHRDGRWIGGPPCSVRVVSAPLPERDYLLAGRVATTKAA